MSVDVVISGNNINVETSQRVLSTIPSNWDEFVSNYGRGYEYPQPTGQTTVYRTGDDADIEATVFAPVRQAQTLKARNTLADFLTLNNNNSFGNTNRFTDINGLQVYGDDYVIDHYTGLMWCLVVQGSNTWEIAIDDANALSQGGFNDWFVPNIVIISSLFRFNSTNPLNYAPFNIAVDLWSSTTHPSSSANVMYMEGAVNNLIDFRAKTNLIGFIFCRKHF